MKLSLFVLFLLSIVSCDPNKAICYDCTKSGNQSRFCLPRADAKSKKQALERDGYSCTKFKQ